MPIFTSVEKLDQNLLDAAADLGADGPHTFWRVILPLTWPGIAAGIMLVFVPAIGMFSLLRVVYLPWPHIASARCWQPPGTVQEIA